MAVIWESILEQVCYKRVNDFEKIELEQHKK